MKEIKRASLYYSDVATGGTSDKEYHAQLTAEGKSYFVLFQYGRRGGTLQTGTKTTDPVSLEEATKIFNRLVAEKMGKGYRPKNGIAQAMPVAAPVDAAQSPYPPELLDEISDKQVEKFIGDPRYWMQVKVNGWRCQVQKKADGSIIGYGKKGNARALPENVTMELKKLKADTFFFDGELVGNSLYLWDALELDGVDYTQATYASRFAALIKTVTVKVFVTVVATWGMTKNGATDKFAGLKLLKANRSEGAVFKLVGATYRTGRNDQHKKYKFLKTASCVVFKVGVDGKSNASLAMLEGKVWIDVGSVSTIGRGKVEAGNVVEVQFLYATAGKRLYQPRLIPINGKYVRDDVDPKECTVAQLKDSYQEGVEP
jgi:bifunctional non-homologous end joining protein LigD